MNLIEVYVTNITKEERFVTEKGLVLYKLIADTDGYGIKEKQVRLDLCEGEYNFLKENGYILR